MTQFEGFKVDLVDGDLVILDEGKNRWVTLDDRTVTILDPGGALVIQCEQLGEDSKIVCQFSEPNNGVLYWSDEGGDGMIDGIRFVDDESYDFVWNVDDSIDVKVMKEK